MLHKQYYTINKFNKDYFNYNKRKNNLSLFHTNIRSSSHPKINLKSYLSALNIEFNIIRLSENWDKQDTGTIDLRNLPGYIHHHYIRSDKRGGGVSLYVKNGIQYKLIKNLKIMITYSRVYLLKSLRTNSALIKI